MQGLLTSKRTWNQAAGLMFFWCFGAILASGSDAILIDFTSARCQPCQAMKPVLAQLEQAGVPIRHVDVAEEPRIARRYGIRKTPTYVVVSGGKELTRLVGIQSAAKLHQAVRVDASGPLIPTKASRSSLDAIAAPQTRLVPLSGQRSGPTNQNRARLNFQSRGTTTRSNSASLSEVMPGVSLASAVERAASATVRLRVHDGHGHDVGTGTIIDTHGDEALVMTCGHLFRESQGQGRIEVDLFVGGRVQTVPGRVLDYEAKHKDIALVTIRPGFSVQPVEVIDDGLLPRTGQSVFSFGCDRGDDPSRRDTRITGVNKLNQHLGASNIEISGAPVSGRSGGGLFDERGRLIGVCNAADYKNDIGIYTGPGSIHWQLDRVGMTKLYKSPKNALASSPPAAPQDRLAALPATPQRHSVGERTPTALPTGIDAGKEVIVIVRDRGAPKTTTQVMTLRAPSDALMQQIRSAAR